MSSIGDCFHFFIVFLPSCIRKGAGSPAPGWFCIKSIILLKELRSDITDDPIALDLVPAFFKAIEQYSLSAVQLPDDVIAIIRITADIAGTHYRTIFRLRCRLCNRLYRLRCLDHNIRTAILCSSCRLDHAA